MTSTDIHERNLETLRGWVAKATGGRMTLEIVTMGDRFHTTRSSLVMADGSDIATWRGTPITGVQVGLYASDVRTYTRRNKTIMRDVADAVEKAATEIRRIRTEDELWLDLAVAASQFRYTNRL